ncbi:MAG: Rieske (2Fe-2S) protein [Anaerolineae bacterium]|nr:Rieske (2Fe-2S) protein [Anaerolineae bacterium]
MKRRDFLVTIWQGIGVLATGGMGFIGLRYLASQNRESATGGIVTAGLVDNFAPDTVTPIPEGKCYLVRNSTGGFLALYRQCTHLSCIVIWEDDQFRCPCHGSAFTTEGKVISPPAPHPLTVLEVQIENGQVRIDTSKQIKRTKTTAEDFIYPPEQSV